MIYYRHYNGINYTHYLANVVYKPWHTINNAGDVNVLFLTEILLDVYNKCTSNTKTKRVYRCH